MIAGLVASVAVAGGLGTPRDAWPSLPVERPVVVPRGWTVIDGSYRRSGVGSLAEAEHLGGSVRYGVTRTVELFASMGTRVGGSAPFEPGGRAQAPSFGARASLGRGEAPTRSLGLLFRVDCPWAIDDPLESWASGGAAFGVEAAHQLGPFRFSGDLTGTWRAPRTVTDEHGSYRVRPGDDVTGRVAALLQVGPLAPGVALHGVAIGGGTITEDAEVDEVPSGGATGWALTGEVQLTRGVGVTGAWWTMPHPSAWTNARPSYELGLRIAL